MSNIISPSGAASNGRSDSAKEAETTKSFICESDFDNFPQIDVIKLIKLIKEVSDGKKPAKEAAKEFGAPYMAFAKVFAAQKSKEWIQWGFDQISTTPESHEQPKAASKVHAQPQAAAKSQSKTTTKTNTKGSKSKEAKTSSAKSNDSKPQSVSKSDVQEMAESVAMNFINEAVTRAGMEELTKTDFDERLIACTMSTASLVKQYMNRQIPVEEFIEKIGNGEIENITSEVLKASGVDKQLAEKLGVNELSEISAMGSATVAFTALTAAYEMVREAQEDLEVAKAHRAEIEAACSESIELIRQYRQEMETVVNEYLKDRIETFEKGFEAMDKAILENDTNGYIRGNVEIQKILGYNVQFTNQEEFDDLMDSDKAFKL